MKPANSSVLLPSFPKKPSILMKGGKHSTRRTAASKPNKNQSVDDRYKTDLKLNTSPIETSLHKEWGTKKRNKFDKLPNCSQEMGGGWENHSIYSIHKVAQSSSILELYYVCSHPKRSLN